MNLDLFDQKDSSGRLFKESYLEKNHSDVYNYIIEYCKTNELIHIPFKEKVFLTINNLKKIPVCNNNKCDKNPKFINSSLGYRKYCSIECISSCENIKKIKEEKSYKRYGTKTPSQSKEVKNKIINTNQRLYGGNSAMCDGSIREKSKETLNKNYGVDNPSKSKTIIDKRVKSFKLNIDKYKENYKKTSNIKYGVDHPWMNKTIHSKTIEHFYKSYRDRIVSKVNSDYCVFLGFEKEITTKLLFHCKKCEMDFKILTVQFYYRSNYGLNICTNCFPISETASLSQIELYNFIKNNTDSEILLDDRLKIPPYEIDILLPDLNIGFEFNGVYWHSSKFKDENYHLRKKELSNELGLRLITIWEDDWNIKRDICKSFILNKLGKSVKIMARKCRVGQVDYKTSKQFLDENHFQGDCKSSIRLGLFYENELVSLMTFSKLRLPLGGVNKDGVYELTRFCNKNFLSVTGGCSKLFKNFLLNYNPISVETYSDNLISDGEMYEKLGFTHSHTSRPGYWYLVDGKREHRFNWRKSKLKKLGADVKKTETEIMEEWGFHKIYNGGNKKWIFN